MFISSRLGILEALGKFKETLFEWNLSGHSELVLLMELGMSKGILLDDGRSPRFLEEIFCASEVRFLPGSDLLFLVEILFCMKKFSTLVRSYQKNLMREYSYLWF